MERGGLSFPHRKEWQHCLFGRFAAEKGVMLESLTTLAIVCFTRKSGYELGIYGLALSRLSLLVQSGVIES
jgi:hypothetical protein